MAKKEEVKETESNSATILKKYVAVQDFQDLQDNGKVYLKGQPFPKPANKKIEDERFEQLLSKENNQKRPVIKVVQE